MMCGKLAPLLNISLTVSPWFSFSDSELKFSRLWDKLCLRCPSELDMPQHNQEWQFCSFSKFAVLGVVVTIREPSLIT